MPPNIHSGIPLANNAINAPPSLIVPNVVRPFPAPPAIPPPGVVYPGPDSLATGKTQAPAAVNTNLPPPNLATINDASLSTLPQLPNVSPFTETPGASIPPASTSTDLEAKNVAGYINTQDLFKLKPSTPEIPDVPEIPDLPAQVPQTQSVPTSEPQVTQQMIMVRHFVDTYTCILKPAVTTEPLK